MNNNLKLIRNIVEDVFMVEITNKRGADIMEAKCTYSYMAQKYTHHSHEQIGAELGINHSTVTHHVNKTFKSFIQISEFEKKVNICDQRISELKIIKFDKKERIMKDYEFNKFMKEKWEKSYEKIRKRAFELGLID